MKFIDLVLYFVYLGTYSIVIPVAIGAFYIKKMDERIRLFYYGLVAVFILDLVIIFVDARMRNAFLYLFTIIDLVVLTAVFTLNIRRSVTKRNFRIASAVMLMLVIADGLVYSGLENNGISNALVRLFIASLAIYHLSKMMTYDVESDLTKDTMFWICIGVMVYNLVGFLDVFGGPLMGYSQNLYLQYYMLWALCTLAMYLLYAKSFLVLRNAGFR